MSLKIEDSIIEIGMRIDSKKAWKSFENGKKTVRKRSPIGQ
jgi:hypothetical protein